MSYLNSFRCANAPTPARAAELEKNFRGQCGRAAQAIFASDVLLVVTGAGFSADSGLAVYADVARIPAYAQRGLDYADLCEPDHIRSEPELFYGFWGQCFNDYRRTGPHRGYEILARWRDDKQRGDGGGGGRRGEVAGRIRTRIGELSRQDVHEGDEEPPAGAFHLFTSNVDAHSYDYFRAGEIYECHGNIELWQCSSSVWDGGGCPSTIWRAPLRHEFLVDPHTMLAPRRRGVGASNVGHDATPATEEGGGARLGRTTGTKKRDDARLLRYLPASRDTKGWRQAEGENWPVCGHCATLARPAILMFGDADFQCDGDQLTRWERWRRAVLDVVCRDAGGGGRVCVLEIGCGLRVPTCRHTSEDLLEELAERGGAERATLVRINPDFPLAPLMEDDGCCEVIPIMSTGLAAIEQIDELYREIANGKLPNVDGDRNGTVEERIEKIPATTEIDQLSAPLEKLRLSKRQIV